MKPIYYCIQKSTKEVLSAGFLPETWGNITGMQDLSEEDAADLSWAGYEDYGFLTFDAAKKLKITKKNLDESLELASKIQGEIVKNHRDELLSATDWVVTKSFETGIEIPTEWAKYRSALRDIKNQETYPWDVIYPDIPLN